MKLPARELPFSNELLTFPRSDYSYARHDKPRFRTADVTDILLAKAAYRSSRIFEAVQRGAGHDQVNARVFAFAVLDKVIQL